MIEQQYSALAERVRDAAESGRNFHIQGGGSKAFYTGTCVADETIRCTDLTGITSYEPSELVITARAGTSLRAIESMLASRGQQFAFEPPSFAGDATLGGMLASGLSGPRRPFGGAVRDAVLGVKLLNGRGQILDFGGQVIKNVAGYDVSRLVTGAFGTLGVILEASVRVAPRPVSEESYWISVAAGEQLAKCRQLRLALHNLTALAAHDEGVALRLAGSEAAIAQSLQKIDADYRRLEDTYWRHLRDQTLPFFTGDKPVWRLSLPPAAGDVSLQGEYLLEWGGALRWLKTEQDEHSIKVACAKLGGHAVLFRGRPADRVFSPDLPPAIQTLHTRIRESFDPDAVYNPGFFSAEPS